MRAVLHADVDRDAIDDAAARLGWQLVNIIPAAERRPAQIIFAAPEGYVHLIDDERLEVRYLQAPGPLDVGDELRCYEDDDHQRLCADEGDVDAMKLGLALLVLHAAGPDAARVALLGRALVSEHESVRAAAFTAVTYAPWPALRPHLELMRDCDPNPVLQRGAAQWLELVCRDEP